MCVVPIQNVRSTFAKRRAVWLIALVLFNHVQNALGYGGAGHRLVGAIADRLLVGDPVSAEVETLLDGLTLEEASTLADAIKSWDKTPPGNANAFQLSAHPAIEAQLRAFWQANPPKHPGDTPSHHWFHYTDVSVANPVKYAEAIEGRSKWDIVQMIPFCVRVLDGRESENNARKITKPIALILLSHYLGDLHQPLHVGAAFFDMQGCLADPDHDQAFSAEGGNGITLLLCEPTDDGRGLVETRANLHGYWDVNAEAAAEEILRDEIRAAERDRASDAITDEDLARWLADREPPDWHDGLDDDPASWAEVWADQILPTAREAHKRLQFYDIKINERRKSARGLAEESDTLCGDSYAEWAGRIVRNEIHLAGWRLAELIRRSLR